MRHVRLSLLFVLVVTCQTPETCAQAMSSIQNVGFSGNVTDTSGAVIAGAVVRFRNDRQVEEVTTDGGGRFQFQIKPGDYTLEAKANGFRLYSKTLHINRDSESIAITLLIQNETCSPCIVEQPPIPPISSQLSSTLALQPLPPLKAFSKRLPAKKSAH
jgi:hypothetical protein